MNRPNADELQRIEEQAFLTYYPPGYLHDGLNDAADLARVRGVVRQQHMLREYARRKAAGEFPDGPVVRGLS